MPSPEQVANFQTLLGKLAALAINALHAWDGDPATYPHLLDPFLAGAARLSAHWYHSLAPNVGFAAQTAPLPPVAQLEANARWAQSTDNPFGSLTQTTERNVFNASRATVKYNADREHVGYARYASANACAFCRVLATRTTLYQSERSATRIVKPRGTRKAGDKYHDDCHCVAVPVRPGDSYTPPDYVAGWEKEYRDAVRAEGNHDTDAIINHMRRAEAAAARDADTFGSLSTS